MAGSEARDLLAIRNHSACNSRLESVDVHHIAPVPLPARVPADAAPPAAAAERLACPIQYPIPIPSPRLWIKRDDQTGLAAGGNKTRKLEFLVADALASSAAGRGGCDTLITTGAAQSNHCRQTAAAAARAGLQCHLVVSGRPPATPNGNLMLDLLFGAELHWTSRENRLNRLHALADELAAAGRSPYFITYGGSDPVGACGYALAAEEAG